MHQAIRALSAPVFVKEKRPTDEEFCQPISKPKRNTSGLPPRRSLFRLPLRHERFCGNRGDFCASPGCEEIRSAPVDRFPKNTERGTHERTVTYPGSTRARMFVPSGRTGKLFAVNSKIRAGERNIENGQSAFGAKCSKQTPQCSTKSSAFPSSSGTCLSSGRPSALEGYIK